jgi:hypothetical protein
MFLVTRSFAVKFEPIPGPNWDGLKPDLQDALRYISVCAAGPFGISLQRAIDSHFSAFHAAILDGASHQALALLLHEAGVAGRDGEAPAVGSISRALNRANAKYGAGPATAARHRTPTRWRTVAASNAAANSDAIRPQETNPEIRSAIEPGAARFPIPPPVDVSDAVSTETTMASALRRGRLLNELQAKRNLS